MYSSFQLAKKYILYYIKASNGKGHGIHSPFVFDFVKNVLNDKTKYPAYLKVESLRKHLLKQHTVLEVQDLGAGSATGGYRQRKVSAIAANAAKPRKFGQLLFRIVQYYQAETTLELGTSLGITTAYLSLAHQNARVITLEGAEQVACIAKENFERLGLTNVQLRKGDFKASLPEVIKGLHKIDFVFVDGNHRKEPTLSYFSEALKKIHPASIVVFDDIHWSVEMEEAWEAIKTHPSVKLSIDLFFLGLVFFREDFKVKQHFVIRF